MKGLLLKDFLVIRKQLLLYIGMMLVYWVVLSDAVSVMMVMLCIFVPFASFGFDEQSKWPILVGALPYKRYQMVLSKYALAYICLVIVAIASVIVNSVQGAGAMLTQQDLGMMMAVSAVNSLILPIVFWVGIIKARFVFIGFGIMGMLAGKMLSAGGGVEDISSITPLVGVAGCVLLLALSIGVSLLIYQKRQL